MLPQCKYFIFLFIFLDGCRIPLPDVHQSRSTLAKNKVKKGEGLLGACWRSQGAAAGVCRCFSFLTYASNSFLPQPRMDFCLGLELGSESSTRALWQRGGAEGAAAWAGAARVLL